MTNPEDQSRDDAASADDATTAVPTPKVSMEKADGAERSQPYYESEWSPAYAETEIRPTTPLPTPDEYGLSDGQNGDPAQTYYDPNAAYGQDPNAAYGQQQGYQQGYAQPGYGQQPYPAAPQGGYGAPYGAAYPAVGPSVYNSAQGLPPYVSNTSPILAIVVGGLMVAGCYTTLIGVAPLVLGIISLNRANSVSKLWYVGNTQAAYDALESSNNLAKWAWISLAIGVAVVVVIVAIIIGVVAANSP